MHRPRSKVERRQFISKK